MFVRNIMSVSLIFLLDFRLCWLFSGVTYFSFYWITLLF
jgi:hypothetical protein